jgi:DNA-binding NarL/FixJ family response regulator
MPAVPPQPHPLPSSGARPALVADDQRRGLDAAPAAAPCPGRRALSAREVEVLTLVARGCTSADVAAQLGLAEATVESHVRRAARALGATNRPHAVAVAIGRGLIEAPRA